jgi:aldehyde dehydrogenase (NAD+)
MDYVECGKADGANILVGGERHGTEGYFIQPTIFTNTRPDMKIVREEIFGPVGVVIKFDNEEGLSMHHQSKLTRGAEKCLVDVIKQANDTMYGLAAAIFSKSIDRAIRVAHKLKAGTAWVRVETYRYSNMEVSFTLPR